MIYQSYSGIKTIFFFHRNQISENGNYDFSRELNFHESMIKIFCDYGHIQLHFKAFAKIYSFKVTKVICTIPQFQLGYIYYKRCASAETTLQLK